MIDIKQYFEIARGNHIDTPLKEFGFKPYKGSMLARMTNDPVFQFIYFHQHRFGGKFTVEIAIRPLYCPQGKNLVLFPGNRLHVIATNETDDKWWSSETEHETDESFRNVYQLIKEYAFPFFDSTTTSNGIINAYKKNLFGRNKFGKRICWGTIGWEHFDFGHIYLKAGDKKNALKQLSKAYNEFNGDRRDWAQMAAKQCLEVTQIINASQLEIDGYLERTVQTSKQNLKLEHW